MTMLAVLAILDISVKQSTAVAGRVNATQRARIAMDTITRQLRSQVCYNATTPAIVSATDDAVKFHADLSDGTRAIEQREIIFNPTTKVITEKHVGRRRDAAGVPDGDAAAGRAARRRDPPGRSRPTRRSSATTPTTPRSRRVRTSGSSRR